MSEDAEATRAGGTLPLGGGRSGVAPRIAGYDLTRVLGSGGMGVVWEAVQHKLDRRVAIKVQPSSVALAPGALRAEALVAARIGDPGIVRVLDVGTTLDDEPYFAMELVEGTDLATLLREGALAPRRALGIAIDIARAVAAAHAHGVVHRDLKPRNVMIDSAGRARVLDFGVAFSAKEGDRFEGMLAGSPSYMAPEQITGGAIGPYTDVFAIGILLYELLTGRRPFRAGAPEEVMIAIATEDTPPPSTVRLDVHADLDRVVARCLAKEPTGRYADARALHDALVAIQEGRPSDDAPQEAERRAYAPRRAEAGKPSRERAERHWKWEFRLKNPPSRLWPYVANTDRFNKAVGLSPVTFTDVPDPESGRTLKMAEIRALGFQVRWREYPFEWVREREHSVFRWHKSGPLEALWNRVRLEPTDDGGTLLTHEVWAQPRGILGKVASFVEIGQRAASGFERVYHELDRRLSEAPAADAYEIDRHAGGEEREVADAAAARLEARGFAKQLVERLASHLLTAPTDVVRTLRPFELADSWQADRAELLDLMIHAAEVGMLQPFWDVICPSCLLAHETHDALEQVAAQGTCAPCAKTFERDLERSVELVFAPHPGVRRTERVTYCVGAPALRPHVVAQQVLEPGEERVVHVVLGVGEHRVVAAGLEGTTFTASAVGFAREAEAVLEGDRLVGRPLVVAAGTVSLRLVNATDLEQTFRVEEAGDHTERVPASLALTHPSFRALFPTELLRRGEHLGVSRLAFVWVAPRGQVELSRDAGDGAVLDVMERLEQLAADAARAWGGSAVPSPIEQLGFAFPSGARAVRAIAGLLASLEATPLALRVAVACHEGPCLALTRGATVEYFGETPRRVQAMIADCPDGAAVLSEDVASDRATALATLELTLERSVITSASSGPYGARRLTVLKRPPRPTGASTAA